MQRLLLVAVDIPPDDNSFKEPIANQGCNVIWILSFALSSWPHLGWKFLLHFWTFKLIGFFGEGTFQKDPEIEHLVDWFDNVLCSAEISRPGPLRSLARSPVLSPSVLFSSVKIGIRLRVRRKKPRNATDFKQKSCSLYNFELHVFSHDPQQG